MTSASRDNRTALQGFLPTEVACESGERSVHGREREPFDVLEAGALVAGKYRIRGELGRGGFAVVYDAQHLDLRRSVALKVLHRTHGTPAVLVERFAREVRISALVRHPHVLEVFDAGVLEDGSPFLVMEKIEGETLHHHLCRNNKLGIQETFVLGAQLLSALSALAEQGIVHRDIKPENMMLTRDELGGLQLKLVDFGIALLRDEHKLSRSESMVPRLTMQGALIGTPHYMAPEQLRSELVDVRVDLYATGVVLYQALTGTMPFDGTDLSSLTLNVLHGNPCSVRELRRDCPPRLARLVDKALERAPERRFQTAADMLHALTACQREPQSWMVRERLAPLWSRPVQLGLAAAALAGLVLWQGAPDAADEPRASTVQPASLLGQAELTQLEPRAEVQPLASVAVIEPPSEETPRAARAEPRAEPRAAESKPANEPVDAAKAAALSRKALAMYLHGELESAYYTYRKAAHENPQDPTAQRGIGLSGSRLGKTREARRAFTRYLELSPKAPDAELVRARLQSLQKSDAR